MGRSDARIWDTEMELVAKEVCQLEGEDGGAYCHSTTSTVIWCNIVGFDTDEGEETGYV